MKTFVLAVIGIGVGLVVWVFLGIGCVELGMSPRFDPMHVMEERPEPTTFALVLEWSFPAFGLLGAWLMPRFARWLVQPGDNAQ